jgi:ABC-2 type transport system ATP-binding protein
MEIIVENLTKTYGNIKAIDNISFSAKQGEIIGFIGPNGAGKTTTMKIISCIIKPDYGNVTINNISISKYPEKAKKIIGYLAENNPLYKEMNVFDFLIFSGLIQGIPKKNIYEKTIEVINNCGLQEVKHKNINELSKGYCQRVGIAQAIIHNPSLLILDEPITGLDPNQILTIRKLIKNLGKQKIIILSTHILKEAEAICDKILFINKGKIIANDSTLSLKKMIQPTEILNIQIETNDDKKIIEQYLLDIETIDSVHFLNNKIQIKSKTNCSSRENIFKLCVAKNWLLTEMSIEEPDLENVFKSLTK